MIGRFCLVILLILAAAAHLGGRQAPIVRAQAAPPAAIMTVAILRAPQGEPARPAGSGAFSRSAVLLAFR
jgi:hypothetical protein